MNKNVFFTVVYPGVEKYLPDFLASLERQSRTDFDLLIGVDGVTNVGTDDRSLNVKYLELAGTPAINREAGCEFIKKQGYENVIFGDSDDYFSPNRVEESLRLLHDFDIVVTDLDLIGEFGDMLLPGYFSRRISDEELIAADFVRERNIFGLTNTAVRASLLCQHKIPSDLTAVDWFLFSAILEAGGRAVFSSKASTYYRQHGENIVGLGEGNAVQSVGVKAQHYAALSLSGFSVFEAPAEIFVDIKEKLDVDKDFALRYLDHVTSNKEDFAFWWENARSMEKLLWK